MDKPTRKKRATQAFPKHSLTEALRIAESIKDNNAGAAFNRLTLAKSLNYSPNSSKFRMLIIASGKFGLTVGGYQADRIELSPLGTQIVMPRSEDERKNGLRKALFNVPFYAKFFTKFNGNRLPSKNLLVNTLHRDYGIPSEDTEQCYSLIVKNATELGIIEEIKGSSYIKLDSLGGNMGDSATSPELLQDELNVVEELSENQLDDSVPADSAEQTQENTDTANKPQKIFIAHGKNKKPADELAKVLDKFKIPYVIAEEEPNKALPISEKIAISMRGCSAGIFIFTSDEKYTDSDGEERSKPNENVIYELGAASVLYGQRIVIFKENGVTFPSDFSGIGYTTFEKDNLTAKTPELLAELVQFELVKVVV